MTQEQRGPGMADPRAGQDFTPHPMVLVLADKFRSLKANPVIRWPGDWLGVDCLVCADGCRMIVSLDHAGMPRTNCPHPECGR